MAANAQSTILVKKSDGTFVRMSLDEVKKMKEKKNEVSKPLMPQAPAVKIDAKSLLEEDEPTAKGTSVAVGRDSQVDMVIKKLSFSVAPNFSNRLRSAVQLRLKEVRGEKETRATVLRSIKDGGLGLTEPQADELERVCAAVGNLLARLPPKSKTDLMIEDQILPQIFHTRPLPVKTTPNNAFVHEAKTEIRKQVQYDRKIEEPFKISPAPVVKTAMKDVVAKTAPIGPVEEIKFFTLTDFRRLSAEPAQAVKRLAQKFINLRDESVLLFWQAQDAWKQSPLFGDYVSVLNGAFIGKTASADQKTGDKITGPEIAALIQMEKDLGI